MIRPAAFLIAAALAARSPDQRQALVDLAYVLGEAHALRQACHGDQTWRMQMSRMVAIEAPEDALKRRMVDSFNAGFMLRQAEYPACGPKVTEAERETAARGRVLALGLGGESP
ncbi:MAG TPA: TIGR02301 family protein [Caulobacteraceae bacterium]|jgi:uncharacterized protein (TIGR02301 family)|nr:TIGR02301 family protein [Caulobacteraceae bacterium]